MKNKKYSSHNELFLFEPKTLVVIILVSILTLALVFFGEQGGKFLTSVLSPIPEHAPFNGTVFPIKQVPDWVKLTDTERKMAFSALPTEKLISMPIYNPSRLAISMESLKWNDKTDDAIRNEKITYPVPYLGNYKLDGLENAGSHPGIDVKIPEGTPVYAIANGTVIKAENSGGGFGNHIVIQHNNFPSLDDPNTKTTLYSSYSHLSAILVKVNDVVTKGQLIGNSGESGTATTPHLHFQIDNDNAPWHPYWPFTSAEMKAAGLSFFSAINAGLGKNNAILNTINPMKYVQKYYGDQALVASTVSTPGTPPPVVQNEYEGLTFVIQTSNGNQFEEGGEIRFAIQAFDSQNNLLSKPNFTEQVSVSLLNGNAKLNTDKLSSDFLTTGIYNGLFATDAKIGKDKLILWFQNKEFSSNEFEITAKGQTPATTESATTTVVETGSTTTAEATKPFIDISPTSQYYEALMDLKASGMVAGYPDSTFQPEREVSRPEAVTFVLRAISASIEDKNQKIFPDVELYAWYAKFVATANTLGFVKGYPDGFFRPENKVNLAEFLTMLFVASKIDVDPEINISLPAGVSTNDWFAPYLQEAIKKSIVDTSAIIDPAKQLTRGEIAVMIYRLKQAEKRT